LDGNGTSEKQYIFSADAATFNSVEPFFHEKRSPAPLPHLSRLTVAGVIRGKRFSLVGHGKDEFLGRMLYIDPDFARTSSI
jgi:hypothetical protein